MDFLCNSFITFIDGDLELKEMALSKQFKLNYIARFRGFLSGIRP